MATKPEHRLVVLVRTVEATTRHCGGFCEHLHRPQDNHCGLFPYAKMKWDKNGRPLRLRVCREAERNAENYKA